MFHSLFTILLNFSDSSKLGEIKSLYQQMFTIQKQIVDKEVEAGVITPDQATSMKNVIDQKAQLHEQAIDNGQVFGPGAGMGFGKGFGQRGAGSGICNFQAQAPATSQETAN